jgi:hypothetical protein
MRAHHLPSYRQINDEETNQGGAMNEDDLTKAPPQYVIRIKGHLDSRWATWFDGLTLVNETDGTATISGPVVDQAALHGLLQKLRDVGIPLMSLTPIQPNH